MTVRGTTGETREESTARSIPSSVHVLDTLEPGGAQNVALGLAGWLRAHGGRATVVGPDGPLASRMPDGVRFVPLPSGRPIVGLVAALRRIRPDVVHAHQRREALEALVAGRLLRIPVVEHAHTVLPRTGIRALSFRSDAVFSVGDNVTTMVTERFGRPAGRVVTIGNVPSNRTDAPTTPWVPRSTGPLRLVAVGRLVEQKDPERFVRVVAAVSRRVPVEAVWLGDGPLRAASEQLAAHLRAPVRFVGHSDSVTAELDAADALVMTSRWEGSPLVALEASLRRRAVISTAASGVTVPPGARSSVVVSDDASDDLMAEAIIDALSDGPRLQAIIDDAHRYVSEELVPDKVYGPVAETYGRLARADRVG